MLKILLLLLLLFLHVKAIVIQNKPIIFDALRTKLTQEYMLEHYDINSTSITFMPQIIMIHHTASNNFTSSFERFYAPTISRDRADIAKASALNVSSHFLVDRDGTIYQLMDETTMARHVIGLNYSAIGIENVGGKNGKDNLTQEQLQANTELIHYLIKKYPSIKYLSGHYEYQCFEKTPLWLETDKGYRTQKVDPSKRFMFELRTEFPSLKRAPCD